MVQADYFTIIYSTGVQSEQIHMQLPMIHSIINLLLLYVIFGYTVAHTAKYYRTTLQLANHVSPTNIHGIFHSHADYR